LRALALLAAVAAPAASPPAIDSRIHDASAAAEALRGPLDGAWTLRDRHGHALFLFELADPVGAGPDLQGAWRDPARSDDPAALGVLGSARRGPDGSLKLAFDAGVGTVAIQLRKFGPAVWRGVMRDPGGARTVILTRP
jgi:hypothetical protein